MRSEWEVFKLGILCTKIGSGSTPRGGSNVYLQKGKYTLIRSQNILNNSFTDNGLVYIDEAAAKKLQNVSIEKGDILLNITGDSVARVCKVPAQYLPARVNQHVSIIRTNEDLLNSSYVNYYLNSKEMQTYLLSLASAGATRNALTKTMIENLDILLPQIQIQKKIAHVLSTLDDKIELNRKMNQTLESMAQTLFKSWFVDFDPVKAKVKCTNDEELEAAALELGISKEVLELFPSEFEESELGMIPKGWEVKNLGDICSIITKGTTPTKSNLVNAIDDQIIPFIKVKDIGNNGEINRDSLEKIPNSVHMKVLKRSILERDDLLFSIAGTIGRVAIVDNDLNNSNVNQALGIIRLNDKLQHLNLVWLSLQSDRTQKNIISKVVQGVQANTSLANLRDIPIIIPFLELLTKWNNVIGDLMVNFRLNQFSSRTLQKTRDTLLPKLLSGELDVSDLDIENEY